MLAASTGYVGLGRDELLLVRKRCPNATHIKTVCLDPVRPAAKRLYLVLVLVVVLALDHVG